jgi:hypothetical protein
LGPVAVLPSNCTSLQFDDTKFIEFIKSRPVSPVCFFKDNLTVYVDFNDCNCLAERFNVFTYILSVIQLEFDERMVKLEVEGSGKVENTPSLSS